MKLISHPLSDIREQLTTQKETRTYAQLAGTYEVNQFYLWSIINDEGYHPPFKVCRALGIETMAPAPVCPKCGSTHSPKRFVHRGPKSMNHKAVGIGGTQ